MSTLCLERQLRSCCLRRELRTLRLRERLEERSVSPLAALLVLAVLAAAVESESTLTSAFVIFDAYEEELEIPRLAAPASTKLGPVMMRPSPAAAIGSKENS
jgi:hypothetical protein